MFDTKKLLTADELARYVGVSPETIRQWARRGIIPRIIVSDKVHRYDLEVVINEIKKPSEVERD